MNLILDVVFINLKSVSLYPYSEFGLVQIFLPEPDVMQDPGEMEMKRPIPAFKDWLSDKWVIAVCEDKCTHGDMYIGQWEAIVGSINICLQEGSLKLTPGK